jgi:hypothetical protein
MRETTTSEVERVNVTILVLGSLASLAIMRDFQHFFSFAVASAIVTLNFRYLRKIMEGFFSMAVDKQGEGASDVAPEALRAISKADLFIKLPIKFLVLIALVVVVVIWGNVNILFFIIGLSTVFLSIVISQIAGTFIPGVRRKEDGA